MKKLLILLCLLGTMGMADHLAIAGIMPPIREVKTGGGYSIQCQDFGIDMRGQILRSCLLATVSELPILGNEKISCAAKYAAALRSDGRVEYCTLSQEATLRRSSNEFITCKAPGRIAFYENGAVASATLKDTMQLPYAKNSSVLCRGGFPATFQPNGDVASCVLDSEAAFESGKKQKLKTICKAGGLITFDEDGNFNGCYPPPLPKPDKPKKTNQPESDTGLADSPSQGGRLK